MNTTAITLLQKLIGNGAGRVVGDYDFRAVPVYVGSLRELRAVRFLEEQRLVFLFMVNPDHAYPQYFIVAAADSHKAQAAGWREMYVTEDGADVKYA